MICKVFSMALVAVWINLLNFQWKLNFMLQNYMIIYATILREEGDRQSVFLGQVGALCRALIELNLRKLF